MIRLATDADAAAVAAIYNHYIVNSVATFEETPVDASEFALRMGVVREAGLPWLVAEEGGQVLGFAYASTWKNRSAYRFSVEVTVYLDSTALGQGWGTRLYEDLFARLRALSMHTAIGGIALPNDASVALHESFGMKKVAHYEEIGFKFDRWIDVGYWQGSLALASKPQ